MREFAGKRKRSEITISWWCRCRRCSTLNFEIRKFCARINSALARRRSRATCVRNSKTLFRIKHVLFAAEKHRMRFLCSSSTMKASLFGTRWILYSFIDVSGGHTIVYGLFADSLRRDTHITHRPTENENKNWCRKTQLNWKLQLWLLCGAAVADTSAHTAAATTAPNKMGRVGTSGNYWRNFILLVGRRAFLLNSSFACISMNTI